VGLHSFATERYICYITCMNRAITQREFRNDSARVLREVQAGETMVVTRNGVPVAELRPVPARRFVPRAAIAAAARRAPRVDAKRLRGDLDVVVEPSADG
jgi:prevent-host-death family protein